MSTSRHYGAPDFGFQWSIACTSREGSQGDRVARGRAAEQVEGEVADDGEVLGGGIRIDERRRTVAARDLLLAALDVVVATVNGSNAHLNAPVLVHP